MRKMGLDASSSSTSRPLLMLIKLQLLWAALAPALRVIRNYRLRKEAGIRAEREHQLNMLRLITGALSAQASAHSEDVKALIGAVTSHTTLIQGWLDGLRAPSIPAPTLSSRDPFDESESLLEMQAYAAAHGIPLELALAHRLQREDSDFTTDPESGDF